MAEMLTFFNEILQRKMKKYRSAAMQFQQGSNMFMACFSLMLVKLAA